MRKPNGVVSGMTTGCNTFSHNIVDIVERQSPPIAESDDLEISYLAGGFFVSTKKRRRWTMSPSNIGEHAPTSVDEASTNSTTTEGN